MEHFISMFSGGTSEWKGLEEGFKIHGKNDGAQTTTTRLQSTTKCLIKFMGCTKKPREQSPVLASVQSVLCTLAAAVELCQGRVCVPMVHLPYRQLFLEAN